MGWIWRIFQLFKALVNACAIWRSYFLIFLNALGSVTLLFKFKEMLKLDKLSLEAHIWKNNRSTSGCKCKGILEWQIALLHQERDHAGSRAADTGEAMHEDSTPLLTLLNEGDRCGKVSQQRLWGHVSYVYYFVGEILRVHRSDAGSYLEDVRDTCLFKCLEIVSRLEIAKIDSIEYFIHNI